MPLTLPVVDGDTLKALRASDEAALEKLFRADYPALVQEATEALGDASFAPRLAEDVMLSVWDKRATFDTTQALEAYIHDAVHAASIREKRRRGSLHRLEAHEDKPHAERKVRAEVSVDDAWAHVVAALHRPKVNAAESDRQKVAQARHGAASHIGAVGKPRSRKAAFGVVLVLAVLVVIIFLVLDKVGADAAVNTAVNGSEAVTLAIRNGQRGKTTLEDGSTVAIGAETKLTTPKDASPKFRAAKVEGTASFAVVKAERPFEVRVGKIAVRVTGLDLNDFAVRAYNNEPLIFVSVKTGSVMVKFEKVERTLNAGEAISVTKEGAMATLKPEEVADAFSWIDGKISFTNQPVSRIVPEVRRWYDYVIDVRDKDLLDRPVTVSAELSSVKDIIAALEKGANAKFGYDGQTPILRDAAKNKKK